MKIFRALAVAAALTGLVAPAAFGCGEKKVSLAPTSSPSSGAVSEERVLVVAGGEELGNGLIGEERGAGGFEAQAVEPLDQEAAGAAEDAR